MSNIEWTRCEDALPDVGQRVMTERGEASRYSERDTTSWWCGRTGDFISTTSWCPLETASVGEDPWSNRMSNIEPTEEQKQAARKATEKVLGNAECCKPAYRVARLLAEREAKLRDHCVRIGVDAGRGERDALRLENDTLRARVAELEAERKKRRDAHASQVQNLCADNDRLYLLEAQHLADIKALREALGQGYALSLNAREQVLKATAHYDDAKAVGYFDKAREVAREVAARPDWKKAGFRPGDTEGGEG